MFFMCSCIEYTVYIDYIIILYIVFIYYDYSYYLYYSYSYLLLINYHYYIVIILQNMQCVYDIICMYNDPGLDQKKVEVSQTQQKRIEWDSKLFTCFYTANSIWELKAFGN